MQQQIVDDSDLDIYLFLGNLNVITFIFIPAERGEKLIQIANLYLVTLINTILWEGALTLPRVKWRELCDIKVCQVLI